ncbi:DUF3558 domain-containing protein [Amycolatopsis sp. NPDC059021]|uniref:DUF3558 domain-containing protein n=1 Tax=Amycolatopsis sp. NPDC059021 TaxID=3346704 RepID=UPI00366EFCEF
MIVRNTVTRSVLGAAAVSICLGASACSTQTPGTATPAPGGSGKPSSSRAADPNVPKVSQPLSVAKYESDPCQTIPQSVLTALRYTDPGKVQPRDNSPAGEVGPSCGWVIGAEGLGLQVILETGNRDKGIGGIAGQYTGKRMGQLGFVIPAPDVDGYPAVYADLKDRRAEGNCSLVVGIADDLVFSVGAEGYKGEQDSCRVAQQAASAVIKTLKGA